MLFAALTLKLALAGVASTLPAASVARTWKVWEPLRADTLTGEEQPFQPPLSSLHWKLEPGSVDVKEKEAFAFFLPLAFSAFFGFFVIVVSGAAVSGAGPLGGGVVARSASTYAQLGT